jgi:nucleotide sugar dehydrogenase
LSNSSMDYLAQFLESREAKIGVFGAGYVGLPLACAFADVGFKTLACDSDAARIVAIRDGRTYVEDDYVRQNLARLVKTGRLGADDDIGRAAETSDFVIVAVPTPLKSERGLDWPDLSYVTGVCEAIARKIKQGKFIILESSVYPGATEEVVRPILEQGGLRAGIDFGLAYSPERIDYGNRRYRFVDIPKVVGGVNPACTRIAASLYHTVIRARIVEVKDTRTAEAVKMLENTYRYVNIALANELAILHEHLDVDFYEVIEAASTKPFGFEPFYPGPGVGGHCIPKDPHYLCYSARKVGMPLRLISLSQDINEGMVDYVIGRLENYLRRNRRSMRSLRVAILGLAFKRDVSDTRNSPSIKLAERLIELGAEVKAYDPLVRSISVGTRSLTSGRDLNEAVEGVDVLVLATPHTSFREIDLTRLKSHTNSNAVILDTRGFWSPSECKIAGFDYVGLGRA